jgi:hypothetical protein
MMELVVLVVLGVLVLLEVLLLDRLRPLTQLPVKPWEFLVLLVLALAVLVLIQ